MKILYPYTEHTEDELLDLFGIFHEEEYWTTIERGKRIPKEMDIFWCQQEQKYYKYNGEKEIHHKFFFKNVVIHKNCKVTRHSLLWNLFFPDTVIQK